VTAHVHSHDPTTLEIPAGDHDILLCEIHEFEVHDDTAPLVFHASNYRRLQL
jgi:flavin reductase (DIM6/NTAB) family NADH-FMN oxidoreductase RutF